MIKRTYYLRTVLWRQSLKHLFLTAILLLASVSTFAYDFEVDGIYYNVLSREDMTCEVTYKKNNVISYSDTITIPNNVTYNDSTYTVTSIGLKAFFECSSLKEIAIGNSIKEIKHFAFAYCHGLKDISIPSSVKAIDDYAFLDCNKISTIIIEDSEDVLSVGDNYWTSAFRDCPIDTLYLGRLVISSKYVPFAGIKTLRVITLGQPLFTMGLSTFSECSNITEINCLNTVPPTAVEKAGFTNSQYKTIIVNVPLGSLDSYKSDSGWSNFLNIKESATTGIGVINKDKATEGKRIYDISGRKLFKPQMGLNIINGKKVFVK